MPQLTEEQALVVEANAAFYRAFESLQIDRMDAVWLRSDAVKCVHPGWELVTGRNAVMLTRSLIFNNTSSIAFDIRDVSVVVAGGIGWVCCLEQIRDDQGPAGAAIATNLFQQNDQGRWLMLHHHASPFVPRLGASG